MHNLLKKSAEFKFDDKSLESVELLKSELIFYSILRLFRYDLPTELHTDASPNVVAAILLQKQSSGALVSVAYHSHFTNKTE